MSMLKKLKQPELDGWKASRKYPLMYKTDSKDKTRVWAIWVDDDTIYLADGMIDGKIKEPQPHTFEGNTLRSGPEQAQQEAEKRWLKQMDKGYAPDPADTKGNKIYEHVKAQKEQNGGMNRGVKMFGKTEISAATTSGKKNLDATHRPMLAKKYKEWTNGNTEFAMTNPGKAIKFPAMVQAKVDGMRVEVGIDGHLESRGGNNFMHLNHIREEVQRWLKHKGREDLILDGELYVHCLYRDAEGAPTFEYPDYPNMVDPEDLNQWYAELSLGELKNKAVEHGLQVPKGMNKVQVKDLIESNLVRELRGVERYQFISEACKITRKKPHDHENLVKLRVFDLWDKTRTNAERWETIQELFTDYDGDIIELVPTRIVNSHEEIEEFMREIIGETTWRQGWEFEGCMIRQMDALYKDTTTHQSCLLKYKRFEDEEWEVYGAEKCSGGLMDGAVTWLCRKEINQKERLVKAPQIGDVEGAKKLYKEYQKHPEHFNGKMLNIRFNDRTADKVPRFPKGVAFVQDK